MALGLHRLVCPIPEDYETEEEYNYALESFDRAEWEQEEYYDNRID